MGLHCMSKLDHRMVLMLKQLNSYLNHFPRSERYGLTRLFQVSGMQARQRRVDTWLII